VIKLMYSETHSWTVILASFATLAFPGSARFIIRIMFAVGKNLQWIKSAERGSRRREGDEKEMRGEETVQGKVRRDVHKGGSKKKIYGIYTMRFIRLCVGDI
jgi:hypothetical protein